MQSDEVEKMPFSLKDKKILIIQDSEDLFEAQELFLRDLGVEGNNTTHTHDYESTISALEKEDFDLILLDMGFVYKGIDYMKFAGLFVIEYLLENNLSIPILTWSTNVYDFKTLSEAVEKNKENIPLTYSKITQDRANLTIEFMPINKLGLGLSYSKFGEILFNNAEILLQRGDVQSIEKENQALQNL
jgi:CheY-like chemotaxis protein